MKPQWKVLKYIRNNKHSQSLQIAILLNLTDGPNLAEPCNVCTSPNNWVAIGLGVRRKWMWHSGNGILNPDHFQDTSARAATRVFQKTVSLQLHRPSAKLAVQKIQALPQAYPHPPAFAFPHPPPASSAIKLFSSGAASWLIYPSINNFHNGFRPHLLHSHEYSYDCNQSFSLSPNLPPSPPSSLHSPQPSSLPPSLSSFP